MKRGRNRIYFAVSRKFYDYEGFVMEYDFDGSDMRLINVLLVL